MHARARRLSGLVVLLSGDASSSVFPFVLSLSRELVRRGAVVHVAMMGGPLSDTKRDTILETGVVHHESTFALEWMIDAWDAVARAGEWLRALERRLKPTIVHVNSYAHGAMGFDAPVVVVGHACVCSWWDAVFDDEPCGDLQRYRSEVRSGLVGADLVVTPSHAMARALEKHYGTLSHVRVIPHGLALPLHRVRDKQCAVVASGRLWDPGRNMLTLAGIAPRFRGPVTMVAAGEERSRAMDRAAIFAHPARYEPFGFAPLEAALRGCALVLGDIESLHEVWGDSALYVDPEDEEALLAALEVFANDHVLRNVYAVRASERASHYTPARMVDAYVDEYHRLLDTKRRWTSIA